jgi:uncharacterized protein YbaR (Trm112 family)
MHADSQNKKLSANNLKAMNEWADALVCPACQGALHLDEARVLCAVCGRSYPVVDGIPVLIVERATNPTSE